MSERLLPFTPPDGRHLVIVVRADPIICGHSTEARNLAEAAMASGFDDVHIVTYPIDLLQRSGLPLKPLDAISSYSDGIQVHRPERIGGYKVLDGGQLDGMSGCITDLLAARSGTCYLMDLYLVPHGRVVMDAAATACHLPHAPELVTISEAVGSDITDVVRQAVAEGCLGAAAGVLGTYLAHDLPVAVSHYTRQLIIDAGAQLDAELGTAFAHQLEERVEISYPAIDASGYLALDGREADTLEALAARGLQRDRYLLFLSRLAPAKGVDDLIHAYRASKAYGDQPLIICGNGPAEADLRALAGEDPAIRFLTDIGDAEKAHLMRGCSGYCLPTRPRPEFVETFGIAVAEKLLAGGLGPVITTTTGGIPEATGDRCLYHLADDVLSLRDCIDAALAMDSGRKRELAASGRSHALQFDRSAVLQRLLDLHRGLAAA